MPLRTMPAPTIVVTLHYGVQHGGRLHVQAEIGGLSVTGYLQIQGQKWPPEMAEEEKRLRSTCELLARRLVRLGEIPMREVTGEWLLAHLTLADLLLLAEQMGRLDTVLDSFRLGHDADPEGAPGAGAADGMAAL